MRQQIIEFSHNIILIFISWLFAEIKAKLTKKIHQFSSYEYL